MDQVDQLLKMALPSTMTQSSSADIEPYHCPICGKFKPPTELNILGRIRYVQGKCKCEIERYEKEEREREERDKKRRIQERYSTANLGDRYKQSTIDTFIVREGTKKAYESVKEWIETFPNELGLILTGEPGNGKTRLATSIVNAMLERGKTAIFTDVPELFTRIKATYNRGSKESEESIIWALVECDVLVLDDIGAEYTGKQIDGEPNWGQQLIYRIIDGRYRRNKPIIYTTNMNLKELYNKVGKRSYDRILESTIPVQNMATSFRREQAIKRFKEGE